VGGPWVNGFKITTPQDNFRVRLIFLPYFAIIPNRSIYLENHKTFSFPIAFKPPGIKGKNPHGFLLTLQIGLVRK